MRFTDARDRFHLQLHADGRVEHTIAQYRRNLRVLEEWLSLQGLADDLTEVTHETVAAFFASATVTQRADGQCRHARTTNAIRTSVKGFFRYLHAAGFVAADPPRLTRRAMIGPPAPKTLDDGEQAAILRAMEGADSPAGQRDRVLFTTMLRTGLRVGSVLALNVEDVDLRQAELRLRRAKGNREHVLPIATDVRDMLADWIGDRSGGPVFPGREGGRLSRRHVARRLDAWVQRTAIDRHVTPHGLRHSFATSLYRRTGDIALVQVALTHRSIESTLVYARTDSDRLRAALDGDGPSERRTPLPN